MSNMTQKRLPLILIVVLTFILVGAMSFSVVGGVATADSAPIPESTLKIGQFSDIHYFPLDYCYQDVTNDNYKTSEFYNSMTGDTKLVIESGMILKQQIEQYIADAKAGTAPQYLFASGDLSKNGEVTALVDVANALRYLQNEVRKVDGYENFQIFATVGNHDLYNTSGALYSQVDGTGRLSDALTAAQFALVFAGLGFPDANLTGAEGKINLTEYLPEDYWYGTFTTDYQVSYNTSAVEIHYYNEHFEKVNTTLKKASTQEKLNEYYQIGDGNNVLSYTVELLTPSQKSYSLMVIDASDRENNEIGAVVRINKAEFDVIKNNKQANGLEYSYFLENAKGEIDLENPLDKNSATLLTALETDGVKVYRSTGLDHLCGGRLTEGVLDWMEKFCDEQNEDTPTLNEETIITCFHQNALPHWEMEDEILKDFTIYNWENTAKRLLAMGTRYVFSGHMHVCDAMTYTDVEGRTLYDFQTGSCVSYSSPRRYTTFERYNFDGKLAETCTSEIHSLNDLETPFKEVPSNNVFSAQAWNQSAFETAYAAYKANKNHDTWQAVVNSNPDYLGYMIQYDDLSELSYNDYINKDIYSQLLDRLVSHFLNQGTIDGIVDSVMGLIDSDNELLDILAGQVFPYVDFDLDDQIDPRHALNGFVQYILDTVLEDMPYNHKGTEYNKALDLLNALVNEILDWEFGDDSIVSSKNPTNKGKMKVQDIAQFIITAHTVGTEISLDETYASIDQNYEDYDLTGHADEYFRYQHPNDRTYRKRMLAAVKDMHEQLLSGEFVENLITTLLDPIFTEDGSLLKTILNYNFDFKKAVEKGYLTQDEFNSLEVGLAENLPRLLKMPLVKTALEKLGLEINLPDDFSLDANDFVLVDIINDLLPVIKPLVAKLLGFSLDGDDIIGIIQGFMDSYLVDSFYVGMGGIADDILIAFATDVYPDLADFNSPSTPTRFQPEKQYEKNGIKLSYLSALNKISTVGASFNAATQDNGRVPSRVTGNFDTANSTTSYTVKFFTEENVYGTFRLLDENGTVLGEVSTTQAAAFAAYASNKTDYLDVTASKAINGVNVSVFTQTKPQYIPLIDLGLLCLTHAEISEKVDDVEVPYIYGDRDNVVANSVIYWNVTTVTISGLEAGKTYYYDVLGNYQADDNKTYYFSLLDFIKNDGYQGNAISFTTAADRNTDSFEFLTIADIQGMIQSMYTNSHKAVDSLLADERVNSFDFILNAGDMCDNGKNFYQWGMALNTYQDLNLDTSVFFTSGNHENGSGAMGRYFNYTTLDENGSATKISGEYYSFDYANAHFTVLDTNDADENGLGEEQLAWLKKDLANTDAKWKFVLMHKSLYSAGSHGFDTEVIAMRSQLSKLFAENGVNIVFGGHDHTYTVTHLVNNNGEIVENVNANGASYIGDGVLYITLGTMGTKFYNYRTNDNVTPKFDDDNSVLHTLDTQTFGKVVVDGDTITYTGYTYNATTGEIEQIGSSIALDATAPAEDNLTVILLATLIPTGVIIIVCIVLAIYFTKKKKATAVEVEVVDETTDKDIAE